jgi:hypothetical protein
MVRPASARLPRTGDRVSAALPRRRLLQAATGAAGVAVAAGLRPGLPALAAAAPTRAAAAPAVVTMHIDTAKIGPAFWSLILDAMQPLLRANPGLEVRLFPPVWEGAAQASMLAGNGPDIFGDFILTGYTAADLALDLTRYVKEDNVNLGQFMQGQLEYIRQAGLQSPTNPNGLYALPQLTNPTASVVNLGVLDQLGLKYPEPDWTYADWAKLWEACTVKAQGSKPQRWGGMIDWRGYDHTYNMISPWVLWGWGGEYVDPTDSARCYLDQPGSIACGEWALDLIWNGVATSPDITSAASFSGQQLVTYLQDSDALPGAATGYTGLKWDFFALPVWPVRPATYTSANFDGIWAGTPHPDAAWTVLKWVVTSSAWQRLQMRTLMYAPSRLDLYADWIEVVRQVAPPLRDKNLNVYLQQAQANTQYVGDLFLYSSNEAKAVIGKLSADLLARRTTVAEGFTAAARQIDALEAAGRTAAQVAKRFESAFRQAMGAAAASVAPVALPAPSRSGAGQPPVADAAQVHHAGGVWTVTGGGSGVNGSVDGLTFAAAAATASRATFTCRLTAIAAVKPAGSIPNGAKFGLMVRGDLSDDAPSVGVEVAAGRGVHVHCQPFAGTPLADQRPGASAGLLPAAAILAPNGQPAANYLLRPVWLRLVRQVGSWTAYTSLDGKTWLQAGTSVGAEMMGVWVGIYATAHAGGDLVRATFDNLEGFAPDTFVRLGAP